MPQTLSNEAFLSIQQPTSTIRKLCILTNKKNACFVDKLDRTLEFIIYLTLYMYRYVDIHTYKQPYKYSHINILRLTSLRLALFLCLGHYKGSST
uniref:Uncharacterized protein n=1 Tax=Gossypium raimondii TaxID=29730 RepID=A0A0D2PHK6_GOSRA|nr:hypothetical protein B456_001G100600 [Gossypium raimondii]